MITWKNYEEYMVMHADGELKPAEEQELMSFLFGHPELQSELTAFSMTKLIPDTTVVFADKKTLLKPTVEKKVIAIPAWRKYAIAAGVAAILFISIFKLTTNSNDSTPAIAITKTKQPTPTPAKPSETNTAAPTTQKAAVAAVATPVKDDGLKQNISRQKPVSGKNAVAINTTIHKDVPKISGIKPKEPIIIQAVTREYKMNETGTIAGTKESEIFSPEIVTNVPALAINIQEEREEEKISLIDKLPIDDLKKKGMEQVATAMASGYDRVNALRQELSAASVSLKIEKRKLIISF